jgi:serpin B
VVLANALYFKGAWEKPFEEESTKDGDFFLLDGKTIQVPMMHTTKKQHVKDFPTFKALRLPYSTGSDKRLFSMFILLPHEKNGLASLEKDLDFKTLAEDLRHLTSEVPVKEFALPKFKISFGLEVPDALKTLGLALPFGVEADLTDMVDSPLADKLYVSNMYHKTFVEVNEKGTEAAAATAATINLRGLPMFQEPVDFVCDHPFLFVIQEELTNVIIFTGRITDPTVEK